MTPRQILITEALIKRAAFLGMNNIYDAYKQYGNLGYMALNMKAPKFMEVMNTIKETANRPSAVTLDNFQRAYY